MSFTLLTVAILGIMAAIIYRQVRWGHKHGLTRSLMNLAIILASAIFGAILSSAFSSWLEDLTVFLLTEFGGMSDIESIFGILLPAMHIIIKMSLSVILFIPIFIVIRICMSLFFKIIHGMLVQDGDKRAPKYLSEDEAFYVKRDKLIGSLLGIVSGFVLSVVILMPFIGALKTANGIVNIAKGYTQSEKWDEIQEIQLLDKYSNDAAATVLDACGGRALYDLTTRVTSNGQVTCVNRELEVIGRIDLQGMIAGISGSAGSGTDMIVGVEPLIENINDSVILKLIVVDVIQNASTSWMEGKTYLGMPKPTMGTHTSMDGVMDAVLTVCQTTTFESYEADLTTLVNLMKLFWGNQELITAFDYGSRIDIIASDNFLGAVEAEIKKNPRMEPVNIAVNNMITDVVAIEVVNSVTYSDAQKNLLYKELARSISEVQGLSGSVYDITLTKSITEDFEQFGIYVPDNAIGRIADVLSANVPLMDGKVTDKEVRLFMEERGTVDIPVIA